MPSPLKTFLTVLSAAALIGLSLSYLSAQESPAPDYETVEPSRPAPALSSFLEIYIESHIARIYEEEKRRGVPLLDREPFAGNEETVFPRSLEGGKPFKKSLVETPKYLVKPFADAEDFRDPFILLRGYGDQASRVLKPGVTVDGLRFYAYREADAFIEAYYRQSGFALENVFGRSALAKDGSGCVECHQGIEEISPNHRFKCTQCHEGNSRRRSLPAAHRKLVANPSDLKHAGKYCGKCHADHIRKISAAPMTTGKKLIRQTRYAWGAGLPDADHYSLYSEGVGATLPAAGSGHKVDELLRVKCSRCHIQSEAPRRPGDYRATGCAACHMVYANDGLSLSRDLVVRARQKKSARENPNRFSRNFAANSLKNPRGYPLLHKFTVAIPSVQCRHCHNANGVGNEFAGLLGKPARPKSAFKKLDGDQPVLYGRDHDFLLPDIHREKGMHCIDCHDADEMKPDPAALELSVSIKCEDCHGTHDQAPQEFMLVESDPAFPALKKKLSLNPNLVGKIKAGDLVLRAPSGKRLNHVVKRNNRWTLYSKVTGKAHVVPTLAEIEPPPAHQIEKHMQTVECHACHARWSANEWGLHLIREEEPDFENWKDWSFSDPVLQQALKDAAQNPESRPASMLDWLTVRSGKNGLEGARVPGIWWDVFSETDWDAMPLGKNRRDKYTIMKPRFQYFFTERISKQGPPAERARAPLTSDGKPGLLFAPHTPHTARKKARPCESCHENNIAVGLGDPRLESVTDPDAFLTELKTRNRILPQFQLKQMVDERGVEIQTPLVEEGARFLNAAEILSLQVPSENYKAYRFMDLRASGFGRLLSRKAFPYDVLHNKNEKEFGRESKSGDYLYDLDGNTVLPLESSGSSLGALEPLEPDQNLGGLIDPSEDETSPPIPDFSQETVPFNENRFRFNE